MDRIIIVSRHLASIEFIARQLGGTLIGDPANGNAVVDLHHGEDGNETPNKIGPLVPVLTSATATDVRGKVVYTDEPLPHYAATGVPFPIDVRAMDWTQPAWSGPPSERTHVGYHRWADTNVDTDHDDYGYPCGTDYYVLPDGSAEIIQYSRDIRDSYFDEESVDASSNDTTVTILLPGEWYVEYPRSTFGSRGGVFLRRSALPLHLAVLAVQVYAIEFSGAEDRAEDTIDTEDDRR